MMATQCRNFTQALLNVSVADIYEAQNSQGALPAGIIPVNSIQNLAGTAYTVFCPEGNNLALHKAIYKANPSDILIVATDGARDHAYFGELLARAALQRALSGIVIEGCVRDVSALGDLPLPVFTFGSSVTGPTKISSTPPSAGNPITIGQTIIETGDYLRGDADGVVSVKKEHAVKVVDLAQARMAREMEIVASLESAKTPLYSLIGLEVD